MSQIKTSKSYQELKAKFRPEPPPDPLVQERIRRADEEEKQRKQHIKAEWDAYKAHLRQMISSHGIEPTDQLIQDFIDSIQMISRMYMPTAF